jgi:excisionase family DNA binding protein
VFEERLHSTGKAAKRLGIHFVTPKHWIYAGEVKTVRSPGGQHRIQESELRRLLGQPAKKIGAVLYARVSPSDQKSDLARPTRVLRAYAGKSGYKVVGSFEDTASGLNTSRRGLAEVFASLREGNADTVIVAWRDRLTRFGFEYLESHAADPGAKVIVVNEEEDKNPNEELVEDLLAIVTSFSGRLYGMRSRKTRKVVEAVKHAID